MQFTRVVSPVEDMEVWNGSSNGFSFVIGYENRSGPGFHGRTALFVASGPALGFDRDPALAAVTAEHSADGVCLTSWPISSA